LTFEQRILVLKRAIPRIAAKLVPVYRAFAWGIEGRLPDESTIQAVLLKLLDELTEYKSTACLPACSDGLTAVDQGIATEVGFEYRVRVGEDGRIQVLGFHEPTKKE